VRIGDDGKEGTGDTPRRRKTGVRLTTRGWEFIRETDEVARRREAEPSTPMTVGEIALVIVSVGIIILIILAIVASIIVANLGEPTM
jgi:hypothetical protein